nr:DUF58 domain-containing protein [Actinospica durhamensis]
MPPRTPAAWGQGGQPPAPLPPTQVQGGGSWAAAAGTTQTHAAAASAPGPVPTRILPTDFAAIPHDQAAPAPVGTGTSEAHDARTTHSARHAVRSIVLTGRTGLVAGLGSVAVAAGSGLLHVPGLLCAAAFEAVLGTGIAMDLVQCGRPQDLEFERGGDAAVRLGATAHVSLLVRNTGQRTLQGVLRDAWTPSAGSVPREPASADSPAAAAPGRLPVEPRHTLDLPPGAVQHVETVLTPTRRGDRRPDLVTVRTFGPFGLAGRQVSHEVPWRLRVLPPFHSRRHLPMRLRQLRETDGATPVLVRGQGSEFDSLREYVIGDDVRSIDWRATARRNDVVVRTWRPERDRHVVIALDTGRTSAGRVGDEPKLDSAMDAALLLAALATRAGDRVDLLAYDQDLRVSVTGALPGRTLALFSDAMATLEPALVELDGSGLARQLLAQVRRRSLIVLLTSLDAAAIHEGLLPELKQLTRKHTVIVASVADPRIAEMAAGRGNANAVFSAASSELALSVRRGTAAELDRIGVEVVDEVPSDFAPALADKYLSLKVRGKL